MLEALRKQTKLIIWIIIGSFLATIFIAWGMHFTGADGEKNYAAKIGNKKITYTELNNSLRQWAEEYRQAQGQMPDEKIYENMRQLILNNMIYSQILYSAALKAGIKASKQEIDEIVKVSDIFKNPQTGQFDASRYMEGKRVLPKSWWTAQEKEAKKLLMMRKLEAQIKTGAMASEDDAKEYYKEKNMSVRLSYCQILFENFSSVPVSQEEIVKYYEGHKDEYEKPDQVKVEYLEARKPTEQDISDSSARTVIITNLKTTMEKALEDLDKGLSINAVASKHSLESAETPFFDRTKTPDNEDQAIFVKGAFTLSDPGELTPIFETTNFYYIIKLVKRIDAYTPELKELQPKIEKEIKAAKESELAKAKAEDIFNKLKSGDKTVSANIRTTAFFKIDDDIPGLGKQQELKQEIFGLLKNEWSAPIKTEKGFYLLRMDALQVPEAKNLSAEKLSELKDELTQVKQYQISRQWFSDLQKANKIDNRLYNEDGTAKTEQ